MSGPERSAGQGRHLGRRVLRIAWLGLATVSAVAAVLAHLAPALIQVGSPDGSLATSGFLFTLVGVLVLLRQPEHRLGPLLVTIGALGALGGLSESVTAAAYGTQGSTVPGAVWAAWFGDWYWVALLWLQLVALPLLFPDGRLASRRWRWFAATASVIGLLQLTIAVGSQELFLEGIQLGERAATQTRTLWVANPVGFVPVRNFEADLGATVALVALFVLGATWSLVARFRRAGADERRQLTVAITGVAINALGFVLFGVLDAVFDLQANLVLFEFALFLVVPLSLGIAILRYRLYEIDRIVSRTVTYALVTLLAAGVYLGVVVAAQVALRPVAGSSDLGVALATLAAAATFRPLLGRVRVRVDRRFNRSTHDARTAVEHFGERLRDAVDMVTVRDDLHATAVAILQPASAGVWLNGGGRR